MKSDKFEMAMERVLGKPRTEKIKGLVEMFAAEDVRSFSSEELEELSRAASGLIAAVREEERRRSGWRERRWDRKGSGVVVDSMGTRQHPCDTALFDHTKRFTNKESSRTVYLAEPYGLNEKALRRIMAFADEGWRVRVDAAYSAHFPADTVGVTFERKDP